MWQERFESQHNNATQVALSVLRSVADFLDHATYGDRPCLPKKPIKYKNMLSQSEPRKEIETVEDIVVVLKI